jgi:hypothetical protein
MLWLGNTCFRAMCENPLFWCQLYSTPYTAANKVSGTVTRLGDLRGLGEALLNRDHGRINLFLSEVDENSAG